MSAHNKYVLQLCHNYAMPFLDVARQYSSLFKDTPYKIVTVYLIGNKDNDIALRTHSDKVIFLENSSKDLRGLKRKQITQMRQLTAKYNFEFAIAHRYKALYILSHIKNLPVIAVHHAFGDYSRFMRRRFACRHSNTISLLGVSNAIRDDIRKSLPKFPKEQIQTLYNRINVNQAKANQVDRFTARERLGISQEKYLFSNVGRLHPDKDQQTLIKAFAKIAAKLPEAILVILGKGRLEDELKQQAKELKLEDRILFLGVIPNAANYFKAFDSFILSSDHEPFGMVLLEAITAGIPVIATNAGGAKEIIQDRRWLFEVGDSNQLAELMLDAYALNHAEKSAINKKLMQHLDQNFSDEAVKNIFWKLSFLQPLLSAHQSC